MYVTLECNALIAQCLKAVVIAGSERSKLGATSTESATRTWQNRQTHNMFDAKPIPEIGSECKQLVSQRFRSNTIVQIIRADIYNDYFWPESVEKSEAFYGLQSRQGSSTEEAQSYIKLSLV